MSLAITRQPTETFYVGDKIRIHIYKIRDEHVRLAIDAPMELKIVRHEHAPQELIQGFPRHDRPEFKPGYKKERTKKKSKKTTEAPPAEC